VHRDPFDRMLIGQAQAENLTLLTADEVLAGYDPAVRLAV
jgi:PIN domain nuclease of toxin-antitoxin system